MNHIYRVIFNRVLGCWQAVTELAKSSGKIGGSVKRSARRHAAKLAALAAMAAGTGGLVGQAHAQNAPAPNQLPQGGNVTAGNAQINQSGNVMNIDQSTQKAIINWQQFNVGQDATVNFNQPNSSAATLNRVLDSNPSQIFGRIVAPGQVILINPNGAYFAPSASVDVGGLIATTHELADKDFLDGNYQFKRNGATGKIINEGELKAKLDGYIALMAPEVRNQGVIIAERGTVALASGEHIQLDFGTGNKLKGITVTEQDFDAQIENKHAIIAEGGLVILSARATAELRASVIKNSGQVVASAGANTVTQKGGRIILEGNDIQVTEGSELIATGLKGGGDVLIGGDWQGGANEERRVFDNPKAIHQAKKVTVETNTKIDASATDNGNGGTVVVWSDVKNPGSVTTVQGEILAKGGEQGGDGGQIETSGAKLLVDGVTGSTAAPKGQTGEWLFDPYNITISTGTNSNFTADGGSLTNTVDANGSPSVINVQTLVTALSNSNVTITTGTATGTSEVGNITVAAAISSNSGNSLELRAASGILVEAEITLGAGGDLTLDAGGDIQVSAPIALATGKLTLNYGQAAVALNNTSVYRVNSPISLQAGQNFSVTKGSDGTVIDYQVITSLGAQGSTTGLDLQGIAGDLSGNFTLGASIDASATSTWDGGAGWQPIGDSTTAFSGSFEGLGNTIENLTINRPGKNEIGLFGQLDGSVSNLQLRNVNITGLSAVGSLAGVSQGWAFNTLANGRVMGVVGASDSSDGDNVGGLVGNQTGGGIHSSFVNVVVTGKYYVGGVVGHMEHASSVANSHATGNVSGASLVGGLVGFMSENASVSDVSATGTVSGTYWVGGLIGLVRDDAVVTNAYATGAVSGDELVGGLVGELFGQSSVAKSYAMGDVTGVDSVGGLVGFMSTDTSVTNAHATGNVSSDQLVGGLVGSMSDNASVSGVSATGTVHGTYWVGGLIGLVKDDAVVTNAYATGAVSGDELVGGLVGELFGQPSVSNSYATGSVSGTLDVGGLVGLMDSTSSLTNAFFDADTTKLEDGIGSGGPGATAIRSSSGTVNAYTKATYTGFDFDNDWFMIEGQTRPFLRSEYSTNIRNANQLQLMAMDLGADYTLANDIDLAPALTNPSSMWAGIVDGFMFQGSFVPISLLDSEVAIPDDGNMPIPFIPFSGSLDGQNFTLSNLNISVTVDTEEVFFGAGLFGAAEMSGDVGIRDLTLANASVTVTPSQALLLGERDPNQPPPIFGVGTLIGNLLSGSVSNVQVTGSSVVDASEISMGVGGLIGIVANSRLICIDQSSDCFKSFSVSWLKNVGAQRTGSETSGISDG